MSRRPLPAITGKQLIRLLEKDGWQSGRKSNHGRTMTKQIDSQTRVTFIPEKKKPLPDGTLADILGPQQTGITKKGLADLIDQYGL